MIPSVPAFAVGPDPAGQLADRVDRVLLAEVDRLSARAARQREPVCVLVDDDHAARAEQVGADDREDADRPGAEDDHGVAVGDLRQLGAEVARREDVRDQDRLLVGHLLGQPNQRRVRVRDPRLLGLQAVERAGLLRAAEERRPGLRAVRVGAVALGVVTRAAVRAGAAADRRADHHALARLEVAHLRAERLDDADALVAEDRPRLHARHRAADEVQVGAADRARRQADDGVLGVLDLRLGDVVDANVPDPVENDSFHPVALPRPGAARGPRVSFGTRGTRAGSRRGRESRRSCPRRGRRGA